MVYMWLYMVNMVHMVLMVYSEDFYITLCCYISVDAPSLLGNPGYATEFNLLLCGDIQSAYRIHTGMLFLV